ncbi:putative Caffeoyl-CoA 3-O-methyltransferase [Capsicum annuum]|nr:putative Caffeoyl-CoA 3-O-methyltransferase [Capsicum annuum]KAF3665708.1 putative Caffeoyl-CoA 3-O-methyltransferase [Capsicum annuum]
MLQPLKVLSNPRREHWNAVKWIMRYLCGPSSLSLYFGIGKLIICGYTDLYMGGDVYTRKPTLGYLVTFTGGAVSWQSRLQKCVALFTIEAEFIAAIEPCKELLWKKRFLGELDCAQERWIASIQNNNKPVDSAKKGQRVSIKSMQTLSNPKVIDRIKKLFGATTLTRKTITLKDGLVVVDGVSGDRAVGGGSSVTVGDNNAPLAVLEIKNYYDYDHIDLTDFFPRSKYSACKCQDYKEKHDGVINALTDSIKELISKKVDFTVETTAKHHNITVDNPSITSKDEEKVKPVSLEERKNYPFEGFNISDDAPRKITKLINEYLE